MKAQQFLFSIKFPDYTTYIIVEIAARRLRQHCRN